MEGEKEDELREKEDELRELKKNLRQEKYKNENEKHWWIEDMQELEMQKEKLEKQIEKQKEKLEEEVKELKVEKNELKVDMNELKTSKDRWELQMQKLQNTLMETTKTVDSMSYFLIQVKNWSKVYDAHWPSSATSKLSREFVYKGKTTEENQNPYLQLWNHFISRAFQPLTQSYKRRHDLKQRKQGKQRHNIVYLD
ncbi:hypothetical protein G9A89_005635 [Geosiphon pyriformis]|nr:hypothetical protein G9A89_005635 [Geosiphon pyriformis]